MTRIVVNQIAVGAGVYPTADASLAANTDMTVTLDGGVFNDDGTYYMLDGTGITVLRPGIYLFTWAVDFAGGYTAGTRNTYLAVNGASVSGSNGYAVSGAEVRINSSHLRRLASGDVIRLHVSASTACAVLASGTANNTYLHVAQLGG